jgi:hypothetical protein
MAALWDVATPEERREMVIILLEPGGLYYDMEHKLIAALQPLPAFLPILRMLQGVVEYDEAKGLLVTERWQDRNRRASNHRSPLSLIPLAKLFSGRDGILVYKEKSSSLLTDASGDPLEHALPDPLVVSGPQRRSRQDDPHWRIPASQWPTILRRVEQGESLRQMGRQYGVSYETIRRVLRAACRP